jgi:hypothetical protein
MDKLYEKNINLIKNSNIIINDTFCKFFLRKDGRIIYKYYEIYNEYLCVLNDVKYYQLIYFPYLNDYSENRLIKKLLILNYVKKYDIKYIEYGNNEIIIFKEEYKDNVLNFLFIDHMIKYNINKLLQFIKLKNDILKTLIIDFIIYKFKYKKITNAKALIYIFFTSYTNQIIYEIYKKYDKNFNSFSNYNDLYIFLKNKGYVNKFYNKYAPIIISNYKNIYNKIVNDESNIQYKKNIINNIRNFNTIDLVELIDKNINDKLNKTYIKKKFIELCKKI